MLLREIFASDYDPSEYEKKVLVNIFVAGNDGLNIKSLYPYETNDENLAQAKDELIKQNLLDKTGQKDFYKITNAGKEVLNRASLLDDSGNLIDSNAKKYLYNQDASNSTDNGDFGGTDIPPDEQLV